MAGFGVGGIEERALVLAVLNCGLWCWRYRRAGFGIGVSEWHAFVFALLNGVFWCWQF
jgi:hypothetical protein